jgi:hypothetical protein
MRNVRNRIVLALALALLASVVAALLRPGTRMILGGLYRGEGFYQGWPTSYWSKRLRDNPNILRSRAGGPADIPLRPATWFDNAKVRFGVGTPAWTPADPWLQEDDPEALPVLQDLLRDPDPDVRGYAAEWLGDYERKAKAAVPALLGVLGDKTDTVTGLTVGRRAALALIRIDPEAALDAGIIEAMPWVKERREQ